MLKTAKIVSHNPNSLMKKKVGRKPLYTYWLTEEGLVKVKKFAEIGLIGKEIAQNIGINHTTLYDWMQKFPELAEAIRNGRKVMDEQVENSLLKRAMGYQYEEETWRKDHDGEMIVVKKVLKSQAPDVTAQIFWLKNRQPKLWRDKVEIQNEHSGTIRVEMGDMEKWSN
ncbi:transposase [Paenisporosarcina indica]|uniref:transposase n=1 Tax=Paenisporosarcina indica TaxID=650093 RepID=UPI000A8C86E8|nr:transposase [Paenisporosarcina indica]